MSDATPAYRGYRLQALYTLARLLEPNEKTDLVFQPEGAEDFAVWNTSDYLLETVQVKAYSANLTLSLLSPKKDDSFLYRVNALFTTYPEVKIKIASFGNIGVELLKATQEDGQERKKIAKSIAKYGFLSEAKAKRLLNQLQIESVVEPELRKKVFTCLQNLCVGIDPNSAFEMLNFWLYFCAENKCKITKDDIIQRLNDIGRFVAERNAHHSEWFRSIVPIENNEVDAHTREKLSDEFYRGISARYDHILADVDQPRVSKLNEISKDFKEKQVVIVHGASGQGKTTIAYRYLHDFFPEQWRFQVRLVENRQQAVNIATALAGQAKAIGIPIVVYLDVSPNDIGWEELVKQLSSQKNLKILVTVREEDFRRASISGTEIEFAEVELLFDQLEAKEIYQFLVKTEIPDQFLDFEDAWNRFGGDGPLMEFVYLVTQGNSLRERLQQQVKRIQDEVRAGKCSDAELELLRLVSVASAFEARLKLVDLVKFLRLPSPKRTLELLEKEYLLRTSENGTLVEGLHPIRSTILAEILSDSAFNPWADSASNCLRFIFEQDVHSFLLYAFSRLEAEPLLSALSHYQPQKWIAIAGVTRALIWLGIKEYVETNRQLILQAYERVNRGWAFVVDFDITDANPGVADQLLSSLSHLMPEDGRTYIASLRSRQTDKSQIFNRVAEWLSCLTCEPTLPQIDLDWMGMAEVLFWVGRLQISLPISHWLAQIDFNEVINTLPLEILADVALGLFYASESTYRSWLNTNDTALLQRFRQETETIVWEDDSQNLRVHFIIELFEPDAFRSEPEANSKDIQTEFMNASMERLQLLRRFFPDRERYGSQGYGHLIWSNAELHDETEKNIPRANFLLQRLVSLNATFKALGEQELRPETWETYTQTVVKLRRTNLQVLQQLKRGLEIYFRKQQMTQILGKSVESDLWRDNRQLLEFSPWLPRCAFDEWGLITENIERTPESSDNNLHKRQNLALEKYKIYLKAFNEYVRTCSNFFDQAELTLNFNPYLKSAENTRVQEVAQNANIDLREKARLSVLNLGEAWKSLSKLQKEFRRILTPFVSDQELNNLERLEQDVFESVWYLWYFFAFYPNRRFQNPRKDCTNQFKNKVKEIRNSIRREFREMSSKDLQISILSENIQWEEERALCIKVDGRSAFEVYPIIEAVVTAIQRAIDSVHSNELRRYAIDLTWKYFVIIPLIQGKSLDLKAYEFSSLLFSYNPLQKINQFHFLQIEIPSNTASKLEISTWNSPRLVTIQKMMGFIFQLLVLVSHIRDFERLPEPDEQGREILQQYIQQLTILLGEACQAVSDTEVEICNYFNELSSEEKMNRPYFKKAMQILVELHQQILPIDDGSREENIKVSMSFKEIVEWANRLNDCQKLTFSMYLFWVSDMLDEIG